MEIIRGYHNLRPRHRGCVATIGNFDGIHLGHQAVFKQLLEKAASYKVAAVVILFEPHPQEFFQPDTVPARLMRLRDKIEALKRLGLDRVLVLRFNREFASLTAADFVEKLLVTSLAVQFLVVGDDFHFGKDRTGNFANLKQMGIGYGFQVASMHTVTVANQRVSSTRIRQALCNGELAHASELLGGNYRICGRIAHGDKRGRTLNFPTANIHLLRRNSPLNGVFVVAIFGLRQGVINGVANIGTRPTIDGCREPQLEVHLLDFSGDIYGRYIAVELLSKIRNECRFASLAALQQQIAQDVLQARQFHQNLQLT